MLYLEGDTDFGPSGELKKAVSCARAVRYCRPAPETLPESARGRDEIPRGAYAK